MRSETIGETAERERAMAKALSMSVLFQPPHYKNIVNILNMIETKGAIAVEKDFTTECSKAGLDQIDIDWLFNYLKHYNKDLAAASDAKWPVIPEASDMHW
jgi:hypothetical protein